MVLYDTLFSLFNQWVSDEKEDYNRFQEWFNRRVFYVNGKLYISTIGYENHNSPSLLSNPQGATITATDDYIQITTNTSGEKKVNIPFTISSTSNCFVEWTYVSGGVSYPITFSITSTGNSSVGGYFSYNGTSFYFALGSSATTLERAVNDGDKIMVVRYDGTTEVYHNNILIHTATRSFSGNAMFGYYTNKNKVEKLKDIRVGVL